MKSVTERLRDALSVSQMACVKLIASKLTDKDEAIVNMSDCLKAQGLSLSMSMGAVKLLEVAGVLETRSLGLKGTYIKVYDRETLNKLI